MARVKIGVGEELEVLSPREFGEGLGLLMQQLQDAKTPDDMVISEVLNADGAGNVASKLLFDVPMGYRAEILRVVAWSPANTPATPMATGWITIHRSTVENPPDIWFPQSGTTVAPAYYEGGEDTSPRVRQGENLVARAGALTANASITLTLTIRLWADVVRGKFDFGD